MEGQPLLSSVNSLTGFTSTYTLPSSLVPTSGFLHKRSRVSSPFVGLLSGVQKTKTFFVENRRRVVEESLNRRRSVDTPPVLDRDGSELN